MSAAVTFFQYAGESSHFTPIFARAVLIGPGKKKALAVARQR